MTTEANVKSKEIEIADLPSITSSEIHTNEI